MSFLTVMYLLTLYPIEFLLQTIFSIISKVSGNTVLSIIILSIVVNTLVLPLYNRADKVQEEAKDKENKIAPMVKHIKQTRATRGSCSCRRATGRTITAH